MRLNNWGKMGIKQKINAFIRSLLFLPLLAFSASAPASVDKQVENNNVVLTIKRGMKTVSSNLLSFITGVQKEDENIKKSQILESEENLRIMSFNVRLKDKSDQENAWDCRRDYVASVIRFHHMDIIGIQEPFKEQIQELENLLPEYDWYGVGLDDGKEKGPYDAIFFRKSRFERLDSGCFYLSPTPDTPSKGWESMFPRGVSWVKFKDKKTEKIFYFFNTHFDYHSQWARDESAFLIREKIAEISKSHPFILTGDFNIFPELEGEETYKILTSTTEADGKILYDAQHVAMFPHHGPTGTWSGFKEAGQPGIKPDYIFVDRKITVVSHGVLADSFDGSFPSDHLPVVSEIKLK
jgi:endonuclease/exonuclease/phosphatase family metal-dependent hydrolase